MVFATWEVKMNFLAQKIIRAVKQEERSMPRTKFKLREELV